jgi:hypothetical protein
MVVIRTVRSAVIISLMLALCCGCSSGGGGTPVIPGNTSNPQLDLSRLAMDEYSSSDECFGIDPRFKGWTNTDFPEKYDFDWSTPPDWALPGIGDIEFDRVLKGWVVDPHHKVNTLTLAVTVSLADGEIIDLSNDLTYTGEILPDGGYVYHWECIAPEKLLDSQRHFVKVAVSTLDNIPLINFGNPVIKPLVLPGIGALYYPWRDVKLPIEEQKFDPMRMLVFIDGDLYPSWVDLIRPVEVWNIKGIGNPMSVEFEQLDSDWPIAILNLKDPITIDTVLEFGPVNLEDNLTAYDTEAIFIEGAERYAQAVPCWCGMDIQIVAHHDYVQSEDFAWCVLVDDVDPFCDIPYSTTGCLTLTPTCFSDPLDIANWTLLEDECETGPPLTLGYVINYLGPGHNTKTFSGDFMWQIDASWTIRNPPCMAGPTHTITIADNFVNVDTTNPVFLEEPRLVYGPEAADWVEPYFNDSNWIKVSALPTPEQLRADTCGIYLLILVEDPGPPGSLGGGAKPVSFDLMVNGNIVHYPYGGAYWGSYMWYDYPLLASAPLPTPPGAEYDPWPDSNWPPPPSTSHYQIWKDGYKYGEKYIDVICMDAYLGMQDLEQVKVRVTDNRDNWTRSGNLLECDPEDYDVLDLMFRDNNMYEDETCYHAGDPNDDDRRADCDGYVYPRPGGTGAVDVAAVVSSPIPPDSITVTITAPTDERGSVSNIPLYVSLYRLNKILSQDQWDAIYNDSYCAGMVNDECVEIYCRKAPGRFFYGASDPYAVSVSDNELTTFSLPDQPVGDNAEPCLYVTSSDQRIEDPSGDYQDYACAIGAGVDGGDPCQDPNLYRYASELFAASYGEGFRGILESNLVGEELEITGACSVENQYYADYKKNVLQFGFEWVKAECQGKEAYYAVQSQADILFVLSHGDIFGRQAYKDDNDILILAAPTGPPERYGQPYLFYFNDNPLSPYDEVENLNDIIVWDNWESNISAVGEADWLVLIACFQLADTNSHAHMDAWQYYRNLINSTGLKSVLGHRDYYSSDNHAVGIGNNPLNPNLEYIAGDEIFIGTFCQYLESGTYQPHTERWLNYDPSVEYGAMCYMEAAWEYYYLHGPFLPGYGPFNTGQISTASAVDKNHRYILKKIDVPWIKKVYDPLFIELL